MPLISFNYCRRLEVSPDTISFSSAISPSSDCLGLIYFVEGAENMPWQNAIALRPGTVLSGVRIQGDVSRE